MNAVQEQVKELVGGVCSVRRGIGDAGGERIEYHKRNVHQHNGSLGNTASIF